MAGKKCSDCRLCHIKDEGYSDYTVEGSTVKCMADRHPNGSFDRFYGEDWRMHWANWCNYFSEGSPVHISVEGNIL